MAAHVDPRLISHVQLHASDISATLRVSSEGLNAPLPDRDIRPGSEEKPTSGALLSVGPGLPSQQLTGQLSRQMEGLRCSTALLVMSATGLAQPWPAFPSGGPSLNAPCPKVVPEPSSSLTTPSSVSSASPLGWSRGISGQVPTTPSLPTALWPPSRLIQNLGDLFLLLPPSRGQSAPHPWWLLGPMLSLCAHHP